MSSKSIGQQAEDHARRVLEERGFHVHQALQRIRKTWSPEANDVVEQRQEDLWGLFDLAAVSPGGLRLVQVTHPSGRHERMQKIREAWEWGAFETALIGEPMQDRSWLTVEVWSWVGEGFHRFELVPSLAEGDVVFEKVGAVPVEAKT